jgi:hypothetical protein
MSESVMNPQMSSLSPRRRLFRSATLSATLVALAACPSPTQMNATDAGPGDVDAGSGPDAGPGNVDAGPGNPDAGPGIDGGLCLPGGPYGGGEPTQTGTRTVTAKIVDETGAPVAAGQPVYICGLDVCSPPGTTDATGSISISTSLAEKKPALKVGDALSYAELSIPLTMLTTDFTAGGTKVINTAKLQGKPGAALTPGTDATSGDVTVSVPSGASVGIDGLVYTTSDQQLFRAVNIPLANEGPVLASAGVTGFELLYGVAPAETTICPPAKITVALPHATRTPNDFGWAPGTAVEFWITTTDTGQTYAPYAGWAKTSDGTVSADGMSVTTTAGFLFLENFAIRKAG